MGGMGHDEPAGITVKASQPRELTYTFAQAGQTLGVTWPDTMGPA